MTGKKHLKVLLLILLLPFGVTAQISDTLVTSNGNRLVGEIKEMSHGVLTFETKYSDSDFKIKWDKIKSVHSNRFFIVYLEKGLHYYGTITSEKKNPEIIRIFDFQNGTVSVNKMKILYIKEADQTFISRLSFDVSLGYSLAKANKTSQFSTLLNAGYLANTYRLTLNYSMNRNFQTVEDTIQSKTRRTELNTEGKYFLGKNWFTTASANFLNSTEQKLKLRSTIKLGGGKFLVNNYVNLLAASGGAAWNNENYDDPAQPDKNSLEAYFGIEYSIFHLGDLDLNTSLFAYPGLTEKGRFRSDFSFDLRYKFVADFFINLGFTYNFDNQPVSGASKFDYQFNTTIGWEL
jgi:hypothetical protein